jgi:hypothetical protein
VRKQVIIPGHHRLVFPDAEEWCFALRDTEPKDIGSGVSIIDFRKLSETCLMRADQAWTSNILFCRDRKNDPFQAVMDELKTGMVA